MTESVYERITDAKLVPDNASVAYFDVETTDVFKNSQIVKVEAFDKSDQPNVYILPEQKIVPRASKVTGLQVIDGYLHLH